MNLKRKKEDNKIADSVQKNSDKNTPNKMINKNTDIIVENISK